MFWAIMQSIYTIRNCTNALEFVYVLAIEKEFYFGTWHSAITFWYNRCQSNIINIQRQYLIVILCTRFHSAFFASSSSFSFFSHTLYFCILSALVDSTFSSFPSRFHSFFLISPHWLSQSFHPSTPLNSPLFPALSLPCPSPLPFTLLLAFSASPNIKPGTH